MPRPAPSSAVAPKRYCFRSGTGNPTGTPHAPIANDPQRCVPLRIAATAPALFQRWLFSRAKGLALGMPVSAKILPRTGSRPFVALRLWLTASTMPPSGPAMIGSRFTCEPSHCAAPDCSARISLSTRRSDTM